MNATMKRIKVVYETKSGNHATRFVDIDCLPSDDQRTLYAKASDEYRRRFGFSTRVVSILLS